MQNTSTISNSDLVFYRRLYRNLVFSEILAYFAQCAATEGLTKRTLGKRLGKNASQITRWFAEPSNLCLDTVSDLLTAMGAAMEFRAVPTGEQYTVVEFMDEFQNWAKGSMTEDAINPESSVLTNENVMWIQDTSNYEQQAVR